MMMDTFTQCFIDAPDLFSKFHRRLETVGYCTEDDEPGLGRAAHNALRTERYQSLFKLHFPLLRTDVQATSTAFDVGLGFSSFYVVYDARKFEDRDALGCELERQGILEKGRWR